MVDVISTVMFSFFYMVSCIFYLLRDRYDSKLEDKFIYYVLYTYTVWKHVLLSLLSFIYEGGVILHGSRG